MGRGTHICERGDAGRAPLATGALLALATALVLTLLLASAALAARRTASSAPAFEGVPYGPLADQYANIYPSARPGSPLVIFIHGGGWRKQGSLAQWEYETRALQADGETVFEIAYRQDTPTTPAFPMEPNDVLAATHWALAHASSYNADASKLVLLGGSAGGQLAATAAEQLTASNPGLVKAVVSLSGPMNFVTLAPAIENGTITNEAFRTSVHRALGWQAGTPLPRAFAEEWSPALNIPTSSCPRWLLFNSENEFIPVSQAREMNANLAKAGCGTALEVQPGSEHAFLYWHRVKHRIFTLIHEL